jgi:hypothetical protein
MTTCNRGLHSFVRLGAAALIVALAGCGSSGLNSAPRLSTIPDQRVTSGATLTIDLAPYASDKENPGQLVWSVVSGGGSFTGSTYSNTFATMGRYPVTVRITDVSGKNADASFDVDVQTASYAVVQAADDLTLYDTTTGGYFPVASASGFAETLMTTLPRGHVVYERLVGSNYDLYAYDPYSRRTHTLGNSSLNERYGARTADHQVIFTTSNGSNSDLLIWSATSNSSRVISNELTSNERDPFVNAQGLVFYEKTSNGQGDIWYFDPATDVSTLVSDAATDENLVAVLSTGAAVFTRLGPGGEQDLYWYRLGSGLVEIGADLSATIQSQTKTWRSQTSDGKVVFEVAGLTEIDLYVWNPANGQSRLISGSDAGDATWAATTALGEIVYQIQTAPANRDLAIYSYATNSRVVFGSSGVHENYKGALSNGDVVYEVESGTGDDLFLYDTSASSSSAIASASTSDYAFHAVLANDKVVYTLTAGGIFLYNPTTTSSTTVSADPTAAFGGATSGGDFCFNLTASSQTDLYLWDESAAAVVTVSNAAGDDTFGAEIAGNDLLFTRVVAPATTADLFVWDADSLTATRLTITAVNHAVLQTYAASQVN